MPLRQSELSSTSLMQAVIRDELGWFEGCLCLEHPMKEITVAQILASMGQQRDTRLQFVFTTSFSTVFQYST